MHIALTCEDTKEKNMCNITKKISLTVNIKMSMNKTKIEWSEANVSYNMLL